MRRRRRRRRTRRRRMRRTALITSNNPHLAGVEKNKNRFLSRISHVMITYELNIPLPKRKKTIHTKFFANIWIPSGDVTIASEKTHVNHR